MDQWRFKYPSLILTRTIKGDKVYARLFHGEGNKLLYELKNLMTFRQLGQLKMTRLFQDGTVITAWSVFGRDFINIDVRQSLLLLDGVCEITIITTPAIIQPMRFPGRIEPGETLGIDYIKTYYTIQQSGTLAPTEEWLDGCTPEICVERITTGQTNLCNPFIFIDDSVLHVTPRCEGPQARQLDLTNHCIEAAVGGCFAEIIEYGSDSNGTYILWKAYSEYLCTDPKLFERLGLDSRTGYGAFRLTVSLKNTSGEIRCTASKDILMDCCQKNSNLRIPSIWWDFNGCSGSNNFMQWGGATICEAPDFIDAWAIWRQGSQSFYCIPEITGACLPYQWDLSGKGGIGNQCTNYDYTRKHADDGISVTYVANTNDTFGNPSCDPVTLTVTDRCGNKDEFRLDCCEAAKSAPVSLNYTSLQMSCSGQQDLGVIGGCPPYSWSTSSGSILVKDPPFNYLVTFTAPSSNVNCTNNPTVTVTDCCGNSASVKFAANCSSATGVISYRTMVMSACTGYDCYGTDHWVIARRTVVKTSELWNCDGSVYSTCSWGGQEQDTINCGWQQCNPGSPTLPDGCCLYPSFTYLDCSGTYVCGGDPGTCGTLDDNRTSAQKSEGCCPINPFTGLPYD